jgi:Zn-dependent protease with chaperone function
MEQFNAGYNDGQNARRHDVMVRLGPLGLDIYGEGLHAHWPYDRITALDEGFSGAPLRIALEGAEARLTCRREDLPGVLFELAPRLGSSKRRPWRMAFLSLAGAVVAVVALATVLLEGVPAVARWSTALVPVSWEVAFGEGALEQVVDLLALMGDEDEILVCRAPQGHAVLEDLTQRLDAAVEIPYDVKVIVLDHPMVNAFALPGGPILIMRGLIDFAKSPDELAGVLAHEMGHVAARHSLQKLMEQLGIGFFFGILLGDVGTGTIAVAGETLLLLSYSRDLESEADDLGLARLAAAGLDPRGLAEFFERMEEKSGGEASEWMRLLSTHPLDEARVAKFAAAPAGETALSPDAWRALRDICDERGRLSEAG